MKIVSVIARGTDLIWGWKQKPMTGSLSNKSRKYSRKQRKYLQLCQPKVAVHVWVKSEIIQLENPKNETAPKVL